MHKENQLKYINLLKKELIPALGCTEPIAIAFAAAKAREVLGAIPDRTVMRCSGNIIKNAKSVTVPNSGGRHGIEFAALLGITGGKADLMLETLSSVTEKDIDMAGELLKNGACTVELIENAPPLQIEAVLYKGNDSVLVEIKDSHTNIVRIEKNGTAVFKKEAGADICQDDDYGFLTLSEIYEFVEEVDISEIKDVLFRQAQLNTAISEEGISGSYGMGVGSTILKYSGDTVEAKAKAMSAAGSDARMGGCPLPVVINCGSGNQGITACMPVLVYAEHLNVSEDKKYRALALSNLISLYQKKYLGRLSAYCGAVCAACGSGAAIAYLATGDFDVVSRTITNTLGNVSGIVCDGAKASCAAKIASCVDSAIMGLHMAMENRAFNSGDGIIKGSVDKTIQSAGRLGRMGMKDTDTEILRIMLDS